MRTQTQIIKTRAPLEIHREPAFFRFDPAALPGYSAEAMGSPHLPRYRPSRVL